VTVHAHATPSVEYIYFNHGNPKFKEFAVRQALYLALDKKAIIDTIYYGVPRPVEGYLPPTSWAYNAELPRHEFNPTKAKAILDQAGWKPGPDGIRAKDGVKLSFTNSTTARSRLVGTQQRGAFGLQLPNQLVAVALRGADCLQRHHVGAAIVCCVGNGDRVLVHIEPDIQSLARLAHG